MYIKWMDTCIKKRVLTDCCCAGSVEEGVMEAIIMNINLMDTCIRQEYLYTDCCCAGSSEGVIEVVKREMCKKVDKYIRLFTSYSFAGSGEEGVMEEVRETNGHMY